MQHVDRHLCVRFGTVRGTAVGDTEVFGQHGQFVTAKSGRQSPRQAHGAQGAVLTIGQSCSIALRPQEAVIEACVMGDDDVVGEKLHELANDAPRARGRGDHLIGDSGQAGDEGLECARPHSPA